MQNITLRYLRKKLDPCNVTPLWTFNGQFYKKKKFFKAFYLKQPFFFLQFKYIEIIEFMWIIINFNSSKFCFKDIRFNIWFLNINHRLKKNIYDSNMVSERLANLKNFLLLLLLMKKGLFKKKNFIKKKYRLCEIHGSDQWEYQKRSWIIIGNRNTIKKFIILSENQISKCIKIFLMIIIYF